MPITYLGPHLRYYHNLRLIGEGMGDIEQDQVEKSLSEENNHLGCDQITPVTTGHPSFSQPVPQVDQIWQCMV